ncbi:extracellular solute-binding protein [Planctomicrobium sp. SH664]|uniref:extracellular solute-binding protein n=1 Tax=Planctomicrobium sp. SH664 TaxID=3448125 RepID=UPI003F5BBA66
MNQSNMRWILGGLLVAVLVFGWISIGMRRADALVVYCAHDIEFSQEIIEDFERSTGIPVVLVPDTEANKSLGLVQRLIAEKDQPRCDVFWNNQTLGTMQLARQGVLQPYKGPGYERIPARYKDDEGLWTGFAGRLRVWIINQDKLPVDQGAAEQRFEDNDLSRVAIALPLYGTTLSHFSILWGLWGPEKTKAWYQSLRDRGIKIVPGNATVKNVVAEGVCDLGWTDTDDFFVGRDDGKPVGMLPIFVERQTICIPNSVAIIRGSKNLAAAQQLVDYLLSRDVELKLAHSAARQIPLGPVEGAELPADVQLLVDWSANAIDIKQFAQAREECLAWLLQESAP